MNTESMVGQGVLDSPVCGRHMGLSSHCMACFLSLNIYCNSCFPFPQCDQSVRPSIVILNLIQGIMVKALGALQVYVPCLQLVYSRGTDKIQH